MKTHNILLKKVLLKQAVATALAILGLGTQVEAFAIGLGDIAVQSYLGQPLHATIKVQGLANLKDLDCFRLGADAESINAISQADLKLGKVQNDSAILTITTKDEILEPITSLTLITECESKLSRNYMLLIDPVMTAEIEPADARLLKLPAGLTSNKQSLNDDENGNSNDDNNRVNPPLSTNNSAQFKQTKLNKINKKNPANIGQAKNNEALSNNITRNKRLKAKSLLSSASTLPLSVQQTEQLKPALAENPLPIQNQARLSISGLESLKINANAIGDLKNSVDSNLSRPNLSLDKQLHFTPETAAQALATETAILDEATVLSNRLAHLENQINVLKVRNAALEADQRVQTDMAAQAPVLSTNFANSIFSWWSYATGASVVISAYFAVTWWRRRQTKQLDNEDEVWANLQAHSSSAPYIKASELGDDLFDLQSQQPYVDAGKNLTKNLENFEANQLATAPIQIEDNAEHNILDHADVFLSHGRIHLAIQLLQNHLLEFPKQSVSIWLFLLELLAKENLPEAYEQAALECKEHFNIRVAEFSNDEASEKQSLEDFVRLADGLEQVWGTAAAVNFCDDLIYNTRLESRVGFDKNVLEEIILLRNIAQETLKSAEVIHMGEKKTLIKERKEAQIAANKQTKLLKMEELHSSLTAQEQVHSDQSAHENSFAFNLIEYR